MLKGPTGTGDDVKDSTGIKLKDYVKESTGRSYSNVKGLTA